MKKILALLAAITLVACQQASNPSAVNSSNPSRWRTDVYSGSDSVFYVQNQKHVDVGTVDILLVDSTIAHISVPDSGSYSVHLSSPPSACYVGGQNLSYSTPTWIKLDLNLAVHATWTSNVIVVDDSEQN